MYEIATNLECIDTCFICGCMCIFYKNIFECQYKTHISYNQTHAIIQILHILNFVNLITVVSFRNYFFSYEWTIIILFHKLDLWKIGSLKSKCRKSARFWNNFSVLKGQCLPFRFIASNTPLGCNELGIFNDHLTHESKLMKRGGWLSCYVVRLVVSNLRALVLPGFNSQSR